MAILYVDLISGNDTTGTGTNLLPYLTVNKAVSIASGPHDIRIAKTTAYISVACSGAGVGWTNNSVTVTTSSDLRATFAVGDFIGKTTVAGNGAFECPYRVNAISATTITLDVSYQGTTQTEASCFKVPIIVTGASGVHAMTLTAMTTLSGGWNLTGTPTQDGETWFTNNASRTASTVYGINGNIVSVAVSNLNCVECYLSFHLNATNTTASNCTTNSYNYGIYMGGAGTSIISCNMTITTGTVGVYRPATITNSCVICGSGAYGLTPNTILTVNNCNFYGGTGIYSQGNNITFLGINNFINCYEGIHYNPPNQKIINCNFVNCTIGLSMYPIYAGLYITDSTFTNCGVGVAYAQTHGNLINNCVFTGCNYNISLDNNSGDITFTGCNLGNPTTSLTSRTPSSGLVTFIGCTCDAGAESKMYAPNTSSGYLNTQYVLNNSFGLNGRIYGAATYFQNWSTYRTKAPSFNINWLSTTTISNLDIKVFSACVNAGVSRTYSFYMKASNASWEGTIIVKWKLNGVTVKTESVPITSVTTSWVNFTYSCDSSLITTDGELSLEFMPNTNAYGVFVDDITVS